MAVVTIEGLPSKVRDQLIGSIWPPCAHSREYPEGTLMLCTKCGTWSLTKKVECTHRDEKGFIAISGRRVGDGRLQYTCDFCGAEWDESWPSYVQPGAAIPTNFRKPSLWRRILIRLLSLTNAS